MKTLFLSLSLVFCFLSQAQKPETTPNNIDAQFQRLMEKSSTYKEYKVIKQASINELRNNTNELIKNLNENISSLETAITAKDNTIRSLEEKLTQTNDELSNVKTKKNTMNFLGIQTNKWVYNTIIWSMLLFIGFLFVAMSLKFKRSNAITKTAKKELEIVEKELEDLRHKSIEKVQKLGRELQDERNKLSKLKGEK